MNRDLRAAFFCVLLAVGAALATVPVLEMGVGDDWSYTRTALDFASTGRLVYNGWATAMLGVQVVWAALFIKLFGFSFTLVRLTTLPFTAGCALLLFALHRRAGLSASLAAFGTLTIVLSPVFVPLAASFMTDVPGLFFFLGAMYGLVRAAEEAGPAWRQSGWLVLAAIAGILGGTVRQAVWLAPLAGLPYVAWVRRRDRRTIWFAAALWALNLAAAAGCLWWFREQPYSISEKSAGLRVLIDNLPWSLSPMVGLGLTLVLLALPVLLGTLAVWRPVLRLGPAVVALWLLVATTSPLLVFRRDALGPWTGNIVTRWGVLQPDLTAMGQKPVTLPGAARLALSIAVFALTAVATLGAAHGLDRRRTPHVAPQAGKPPQPATGARCVLPLFLWFGALYVPLLAARAAGPNGVFDRYLIVVLPLVSIGVLRHYQRDASSRTPVAGWALVGLFAAYGVAATHDHLALLRAIQTAATRLTAAGVPRTQILAGFEFDAWTQLQQTGYYNDARIEKPVGAFRPRTGPPFPIASAYWFYHNTPSVTFRYFVVLSPQQGLLHTRFAPVTYTTWLPPFHRKVWIQQVD